MSETYIGIVQQGLVTSQKLVSVDSDEQAVQAAATAEAERLNAEQTGFADAYVAVVLRSE